jgi:DNA polymerase-4
MEDKILHLDLDAFYPSVEMLDDRTLVGKPVIVGGVGPRGVVASASYEARRSGVHSAMPTARARRLCPDGIYLRPRFDRYRALSRQIFALYREWTPLVEPLSLDEAYLDVTDRPEPAPEIAARLRAGVYEATGLTVSAGVAHNKFLAKLASDLDKPDGLTVIARETAAEFIAPMPVGKLWGVGPATAKRLETAGFSTIGDLAAGDADRLSTLLGKQARRLLLQSRAIDRRRVAPPGMPKSISVERTFDVDLRSWSEAADTIRDFAERLSESLERRDLYARTAVLKVRFRDFTTITRSWTPGTPLRGREQLLDAARELARRVGLRRGQAMRLLGLGAANLRTPEQLAAETPASPSAGQLSLFADPEEGDGSC